MLIVFEIILSDTQHPFDLDLTLSCGQIFGWKKREGTWKGVHHGRVLSLNQNCSSIRYSGLDEETICHFLGLNDNIEEIYSSIRNSILYFTKGQQDHFFQEKFEKSKGLRILRQEPWECLFSFICSSNSHVRMIEKRISLLMEYAGLRYKNGENLFPCPSDLSGCHEDELRRCLTGYRATYLLQAAEIIKNEPGFLERISHLPYEEAKKTLMILPGVGPKVADCVLLFGFERLEAVPVDTRIRKIITEQYRGILNSCGNDHPLSYDTIARFCRAYFGPYAGYAQQYLFATRDL